MSVRALLPPLGAIGLLLVFVALAADHIALPGYYPCSDSSAIG